MKEYAAEREEEQKRREKKRHRDKNASRDICFVHVRVTVRTVGKPDGKRTKLLHRTHLGHVYWEVEINKSREPHAIYSAS